MYAWIAPLISLALLAVPAVASAQTGDCERVDPVRVGRVWGRHNVEERRLVLTTCDGRPNREALDALSVLARPQGVDPPSEEELERFAERDGRMVAPQIPRLHPGLLTRLQSVADRFPGRRIEIISGYRPRARRTSRHRHARALDIRVQGVSRAHVSEHARTLPETGVGYYPNSLFTHIDVRERSAYWVDRSGPGQSPDYGPARRPAREVEEERQEIVAKALAELDDERRQPDPPERETRPSRGEPAEPDDAAPAASAAADASATQEQPPGDGIDWTPPDPFDEGSCEDEEPPLTAEEVDALRRQLLEEIRAIRE